MNVFFIVFLSFTKQDKEFFIWQINFVLSTILRFKADASSKIAMIIWFLDVCCGFSSSFKFIVFFLQYCVFLLQLVELGLHLFIFLLCLFKFLCQFSYLIRSLGITFCLFLLHLSLLFSFFCCNILLVFLECFSYFA